MGATLDRSKDFSEVFGGNHSFKYEQDGRQFDALGNEISGEINPSSSTVQKPKRGRKPASAVLSADEQIAAVMGDASGLEN